MSNLDRLLDHACAALARQRQNEAVDRGFREAEARRHPALSEKRENADGTLWETAPVPPDTAADRCRGCGGPLPDMDAWPYCTRGHALAAHAEGHR